jgi:N-acyl-phosphatidylethanolamine-hydrolysing phospholipase D
MFIYSNSVSHKVGVKQFNSKRFRNVPIKIERLPRVDVVLLSHDHYDHLDENTVIELNKKFGQNLTWLVPVGKAKWFDSVGIKNNLHEFSWWQTKKIDNLEFAFTPAQHWSTDHNKSLWGGWAVIGPKKRFYFAGDTGELLFKIFSCIKFFIMFGFV